MGKYSSKAEELARLVELQSKDQARDRRRSKGVAEWRRHLDVRTHMSDATALRQAQIEKDREAKAAHERRLSEDSERATAAFKTHVVCGYWYCRHEAWLPKIKTRGRRFRCTACGTRQELRA